MLCSISAFQQVQGRQIGRLRIDPDNHFKSNIQNGNRLTTIFNEHTDEVISFDVKDSFIASCSENEVIVRKNGQCLWTYPIMRKDIIKATVKIIDGYLVFFSSMATNHKLHRDNQLLFLNLSTGAKVFELQRNNKFGVGKVAFCGNRVFTLLCGDDIIREWGPNGKCLKQIPTNASTGILSCNDKYLVHAYQDRVSINYLAKNRSRQIVHLPKCRSTWQKIKCLFLDGNRLFCGLTSKSKNTLYDFHVIDLERGCISRSYLVPKSNANRIHLKNKYNYIKSIAAFKERVFIGNSKGEIVTVNLSEEKPEHHVLEQPHQARVTKLIVSDNVLISTSDWSFMNAPAEVKFWDLYSLKQITSANLPSIIDCHYDNWNLFTGTEMSIVKWDYQNIHKGEKFTEGSAMEVRELDLDDDFDSVDSNEDFTQNF